MTVKAWERTSKGASAGAAERATARMTGKSFVSSNLALAFIRSSKDRRLTPENLRALLDRQPAPLPLAELGLEIYADYQRALNYRAAVDFDDLIRLALDILEMDEEYLERVLRPDDLFVEAHAEDDDHVAAREHGDRSRRRP